MPNLPSTAACLRRLGAPPLMLVRTDSSVITRSPDGALRCQTGSNAQIIRRDNVTRAALKMCQT